MPPCTADSTTEDTKLTESLRGLRVETLLDEMPSESLLHLVDARFLSVIPAQAGIQGGETTLVALLGWTAPTRHLCAKMRSSRSQPREPSVEKLIRIGVDTSKSVFQLHGVNETENVVLRRKLQRRQMLSFFAQLEPTKVGMEACGGSHYWARELQALGHEVVLLAPQYAKMYVKRGKNDAADAEAICEAMSRPTMRFVPMRPQKSRPR